MELLDKGDRTETCEFTVIGGKGCKLTRSPSNLRTSPPSSLTTLNQRRSSLPDKCSHCEGPLRNGGHRGSGSNSEEGSSSGSSLGHSVVVKWDQEDVMAWLREAGFECYQVRF